MCNARIIKFCLALVLFAGLNVVSAQNSPGGQGVERPSRAVGDGQLQERHIQNLREQLALTPEQEASIRQIMERQRAETAAINEERRREMEARRVEQQARLQKFDEEIKAVLTPEQRVKYDQVTTERRENAKQRVRERRGGVR